MFFVVCFLVFVCVCFLMVLLCCFCFKCLRFSAFVRQVARFDRQKMASCMAKKIVKQLLVYPSVIVQFSQKTERCIKQNKTVTPNFVCVLRKALQSKMFEVGKFWCSYPNFLTGLVEVKMNA